MKRAGDDMNATPDLNRRVTQKDPRQCPEGTRVIVYSGPHYGRVHRIESFSGSRGLIGVVYRGDHFAVPWCDCEVVGEGVDQVLAADSQKEGA